MNFLTPAFFFYALIFLLIQSAFIEQQPAVFKFAAVKLIEQQPAVVLKFAAVEFIEQQPAVVFKFAAVEFIEQQPAVFKFAAVEFIEQQPAVVFKFAAVEFLKQFEFFVIFQQFVILLHAAVIQQAFRTRAKNRAMYAGHRR